MNNLYYNYNDKDKLGLLLTISNPKEVIQKAKEYLGNDVEIFISSNKNKKYMVLNPETDKMVHFGSFNPPMEDYTFHRDLKRRENYLKRTANIRGSWKNDKYSANNLSRILLWDAPF